MSELVKEYQQLNQIFKSFLYQARDKYRNTQNMEIQFERITDANWHAKTGAQLQHVVNYSNHGTVGIKVGALVLAITACQEENRICYVSLIANLQQL